VIIESTHKFVVPIFCFYYTRGRYY